jgi:exopolysaccharide biosynthesis polyprenyl glycosylphosphotransferase
VVIVYALITAYWLRFATALSHYGVQTKINFSDYTGYIVFGALSLIFTLMYCQVYDRQKLLRLRKTIVCVVKASLLWYVGFLSFSLMFKFQPPISRVFVSIAAINVLGGLLVWRWMFHRLLQRSSIAARLRQRILFVGWNEESARLTEGFEADYARPYDVMGCVTAARAPFGHEPQVRVLGEYDEISQIIRRQAIDMVILTDVSCVKGEIVGLANLCEKEMVQFKVIPSYFQILVSGLHLETVSGIPVLGVTQLPLDRMVNLLIKRGVDILGAIVGLILSAPLIAIFGLIVYMESPGPIFYRQRRMGRNGEPFDIFKIRSMRLDAEKGTGARWAQKADPRRLRVGAFMRAWNIDEVPQFWNVLKGEMSLVGPRPERPELIENFKEEVPHYNARHGAKPGITGWAQIKGLRGDTDLSERIRADLFYLENWNLLLDFQIMLLTFLRRDNAY